MNLKSYICSFSAGALMMLSACSPENYELGAKDVTMDDLVEGIAYSVTVDQTTNTVRLKSLMGEKYTVLWSHPQGRSQAQELSLKIPFAGVYEVKFGVQTRGGAVYGEPFSFDIKNLKPELLENPLWNIVSGGVGKSKKWVLDINAEGQCKHFVGPLYFYGTDHNWNTVTLGQEAPEGADSWSWQADWAGNSWLLGGTGAMDYGSMTFDLIDGANVTVEDKAAGKTYKGTYMMDTDNYTMKLTDAPLLHDPGRDAIVTQWGSIKILSMTENYMQLAVLRDNDPSEGPCLLVYNFISQDYADNWTPPVDTGGSIEDPYSGNANTEMTTVTTTTMTWKLNAASPYDWYWWNGADGAWESNGFVALSDYSNTNWAPVPVASSVKKFALTMTKNNDEGGQYTLVNTSGETIEGKYTSEGSWINFGKEVTLFEANGTLGLTVKAQKVRIVKSEKKNGQIVEMWLGAPNKQNAKGEITEYICVKLKPEVENTGVIPARLVEVDNSKILYGDLEGKGNFRIEIFNTYGSGTKTNSPINVEDINFEEKCLVTFSLSGLGELESPAQAFLMCSNANVWKLEAEGVISCEVTGDGTYTVGVNAAAAVEKDKLVFVIDIIDVQSKTSVNIGPGDDNRCPNVTARIESIKMDGNEGSAKK